LSPPSPSPGNVAAGLSPIRFARPAPIAPPAIPAGSADEMPDPRRPPRSGRVEGKLETRSRPPAPGPPMDGRWPTLSPAPGRLAGSWLGPRPTSGRLPGRAPTEGRSAGRPAGLVPGEGRDPTRSRAPPPAGRPPGRLETLLPPPGRFAGRW